MVIFWRKKNQEKQKIDLKIENCNQTSSLELEKNSKNFFLASLANRLAKTKEKISTIINILPIGKKIDDQLLDELEEALITADLGAKASLALISDLRNKFYRQELNNINILKINLRENIKKILNPVTPFMPLSPNRPHIIVLFGVNGVGKTTTVAKLAYYFQKQGLKVLLGAADTFRAAAIEQLELWAHRMGCNLIRHQQGSDPSAVAYDTVDAVIKRNLDIAIIDTAGRLHTKINLMEEIKKIQRVIKKRLPGAPHESILILDASTGQNAINQAKYFNEAVSLTGIILTKLDGTAKGGIVVGLASEIKLPIFFIGLGETINDLKPFNPQEFVEAIF